MEGQEEERVEISRVSPEGSESGLCVSRVPQNLNPIYVSEAVSRLPK